MPAFGLRSDLRRRSVGSTSAGGQALGGAKEAGARVGGQVLSLPHFRERPLRGKGRRRA